MVTDVNWERRVYEGYFLVYSHGFTRAMLVDNIGYSLTVVVFTYEVLVNRRIRTKLFWLILMV